MSRWRTAELASALLLTAIIASGTAFAQAEDPFERIGREFQRVLALLDPGETGGQRIASLRKALAGFEELLGRVREEYGKAPSRRAEQERIEFHLHYLIKWTRHLITIGGGDPDRAAGPDPEEARAEAVRRLEGIHRYEREHVGDRKGILELYLQVLPLVRGTALEREVMGEINRIWAEVDANRSTPPSPAPERGVPAAAPEREGPAAAPEANPPDKPKIPSEGALTAEQLKELREQLADGPAAARIAAADRLASVDKPWVGPLLVDRLEEEEDKAVRSRLSEIIVRVGDRHMVRTLGKWSRNKDPERRQEAIRLLGRIGGPEAGKALQEFAGDADMATVRLLIQTAKGLQEGAGVVALAKSMKQHPTLRFEIIEALAATRHEDGARALIPFLHRRRFPEFKDPAMKGLRILGPHAVEPLIEALEGRDYRQYAAVALRSITGERFGISPGPWQQWWRQNRKRLLQEKQ